MVLGGGGISNWKTPVEDPDMKEIMGNTPVLQYYKLYVERLILQHTVIGIGFMR